MRYKNNIILIITLVLSAVSINVYSQQDLSDQIPQQTLYDPADVVDSIHGITIYERLNHRLSWDSTRHCKGYACDGLVKDYYTNGKMLHKGYYTEGQLNSYTNYYPDGQKERSFVILDDFESEMTLFYPDGKIKSKQKYYNYTPTLWKDYYDNGELSYHMEYDKELGSHIIKRTYSELGILTSEMYLSNKKKKLFRQNVYYETGVPSTKGVLTFDEDLLIHIKNGKWFHYYPNGKVSKVEVYLNNEIVSQKEKADI